MAGRKKKEFATEVWQEMVDVGFNMFMRGQSVTIIKRKLLREFGLPMNQFLDVLADVKKLVIEKTEIYNDKAKELQIARLESLLSDVTEQGDAQMALKVLAEINKLLGLYEQKIKIDTTTYEVKL